MHAARCSLPRLVRPHSLTCALRCSRARAPCLSGRRFASSASPHASAPAGLPSAAQHPLAAFGGLTDELDRIAPRFDIDSSDIEILKEPAEFYALLKSKIANAKRRIYISTLYVGKTEHDLIATIHAALAKNPDLTISFLTDALRGTRESPEPSCASLLVPLVRAFGPERVRVRMFHTPNLVGLKKAVLPKRINEGWGLQHMKLYGVDDDVIMSGANLSNDYFTNRQDRYHVFRSAALTAFYERVHDAVSTISFDVRPDDSQRDGLALVWPSDAGCPSPLQDVKRYKAHAAELLEPLIKPSATAPSHSTAPTTQTVVYPLFQLAPLLPGTPASPPPSTELPALRLLLQRLSTAPFAPARWTFTAGYFNMTPGVRDMLLSSLQQAEGAPPRPAGPAGTVLTAHPLANGFHASAGVSGLLPPAYTLLAARFLAHAARAGAAPRLRLHEWRRGTVNAPGGWSYHAKGLWVWLPAAADGPALTLVGSSNYTARSHTLDLEANALVLTADAGLRARLAAEEAHLMEHAGAPVGADTFAREDRRVGWRVRLALWIVGVVGGAL